MVKVFVVVFGIAGVVGVSQLLVRPLIEPWLKDYMNVDYVSGLAFIIMSIALYILLYLWTEKELPGTTYIEKAIEWLGR